MVLSPFSHSQEETLLFKDPLNKEPILNPAERATGTLANEICYSFFIDTPSLNQNDISNLRIDENQGICWGDGTTNDGDYDRISVAPSFPGGINFVSANKPKELFNWGPHLAGKHYIIRFSSMRGNSNPLSFGIRDNDSLEGSWKLVANRRYYLAFLNIGKHLVTNSFNRFNIPEKDNEAMIESEGAVKNALQGNGPFEWKIEIDDLRGFKL